MAGHRPIPSTQIPPQNTIGVDDNVEDNRFATGEEDGTFRNLLACSGGTQIVYQRSGRQLTPEADSRGGCAILMVV
jgi:hypothetical protein